MGRRGAFPRALIAPLVLAVAALAPFGAEAQASPRPATGPVIEDFGPVYDVADPDFTAPRDQVLRVVFEVSQASSEPDRVNPRLETLARYLNLHARAGVPRENMKLALVVHGPASWEMVSDPTYRSRFDTDNPNLPLLEALSDFGVEVLLCGQSQHSRGITRDQLASPVSQALSAMTALVDLQSRGYQLIAF